MNGTAICDQVSRSPVCDVNNQDYQNSCFLAHNNKKYAYRGPCLHNCRNVGEVCGINGKTYVSECAAFADYVSVDYGGPCVTVGLITDKKTQQCPGVQCRPLPDANCLGFTPPGACCPVCAGALRLLYSKKQIDRALYVLNGQSTRSLTLNALLEALERRVQVAQCALRGYLTVESDIFVMVESTEAHPSGLQLETCVREAEKIASMINTQSPRLVSELSLSSLVLGITVHTQVNAGFTVSTGMINIAIMMNMVIIVRTVK